MNTQDKPKATIHPHEQWAALTIGGYKIVTEAVGSELRVTVYRVEPDYSWTHLNTEFYPINSTEEPQSCKQFAQNAFHARTIVRLESRHTIVTETVWS